MPGETTPPRMTQARESGRYESTLGAGICEPGPFNFTYEIEGEYLNPKKALKKGLSGITEQNFVNTMASFVKERDSQEGDMLDDNLLKEKYPFYKQLMKMSVAAAKDGNAIQIAHLSGMAIAYRILLQIAEEKV